MTGCMGSFGWSLCVLRHSYPMYVRHPRVGTWINILDTTMKDPKFPKEVFAPTISRNELRERKRKMERALDEASEAIRTAKEEFHYMIYGTEDTDQSILT
uniref:Uncharacterized protein n=2 Tax=Candidatus Kentrum sp. TUN TaxID=2126343 RepID=A0A450ZAD8_9GAMM|nr:MAG: hypothetical protein BECKTUN1418D_GA0071000_10021 [Candidatus Kentron sp. TUN]